MARNAAPREKASVRMLLRAGLVRKEFVRGATAATRVALERFADDYAEAFDNESKRISVGAFMIREGNLDPRLIENIIVADDSDHKDFPKYRAGSAQPYAFGLAEAASIQLKRLVRKNGLDPAVFLHFCRNEMMLTEPTSLNCLAKTTTAGASNIINWGITGIIEHEAAQNSVWSGGSRRDEFYTEPNRLLKTFRATESVVRKRKQVERVIQPDDERHVLHQLADVWQHYAAQSSLFQSIATENPVLKTDRARNIERVNDWQAQATRMSIGAPHERFLDVYGRYNHAEMDPLMLAIIARTAGWYIDNHHARLFTKIRLVPDHRGDMVNKIDAVPWGPLAFYRNMSVLKLSGYEFRMSMLGANRMFLTHSKAKEASDVHSIPIITMAVWRNPAKLGVNRPHAFMATDFDWRDEGRFMVYSQPYKNQGASFTGVITETLRAIREAETLEIARAEGAMLIRNGKIRWMPEPPKPGAPENYGMQQVRYG